MPLCSSNLAGLAWPRGIKMAPPTRFRARALRGGLLQVGGLSTTVMRVAAAPGRPMHDLKKLIRTIPDYPKPGIMFRDVTTLLGDAQGFKAAIARMAEPYRTEPVDAVAGIEARGFILGGAIADRLGCAFIPMRKKGRLPWKT